MPLTPLLFRLNAVNVLLFWLNAINAAIFPFQRRWRRFFSGSTLLTPLFFRLNAVNAAIFLVKRR